MINCSCGYIESLFSAVADNTAHDVFRAHFAELVLAMYGPTLTALIPVLHSKRLISDIEMINLTTLSGVGDFDKATRLLSAIEAAMKFETRGAARVLREFCEAASDQLALKDVVDSITTALGELVLLCNSLLYFMFFQINLLPCILLELLHQEVTRCRLNLLPCPQLELLRQQKTTYLGKWR